MSMRLIVPKLDLDMGVEDGTTQKAMRFGPALFEYSNLPGDGDKNVSIAAHREGGVFFHLDKVGEGDYIYVVYDEILFRYMFYDVNDVMPTNWDIISNQGFPCVTLVTCTPLGIANKRMVVRGKLVDMAVFSEDLIQ